MSTTHWTLRNRLRRAIRVAAVSLGLVMALALLAAVQLARYIDEVTDTVFTAVIELEELQADLTDADAAVRAFALSGNPAFLEPYERLAYDRAEGIHARLAEGTDNVSHLDPLFDELGQAVDEWRAGYADPLIEATQAGGAAEAYLTAQETRADLTDAAHQELRITLDELIDYRSQGADSMRIWQWVLFGSVVALTLGAIAAGILLWRNLHRWVTDPLEELAHSSRSVAEGDLDTVVVGTGPHEIVVLGEDIDRMRRHLVAQIASTEVARGELEASNRDLEQFAYVASHDLQEPLRKVASFTQLLQRRYGDQLDDRGHQYIEFAADGAKRMQRLIQDLLAFSRLGRGGEEPSVVSLDKCLADALIDLSETIAETGAEVSADPLPEVLGHEGILGQLLQNLIGNAIKFRRPDVPPRVHIGVERVAHEWLLRCSDNGIGIEPRHAERVFTIFQRLHAKDAYGGTGIGLAMCKRIVEYHGGRIWVETRESGEGTTVRWTLPVLGAAGMPIEALRSAGRVEAGDMGDNAHAESVHPEEEQWTR